MKKDLGKFLIATGSVESYNNKPSLIRVLIYKFKRLINKEM